MPMSGIISFAQGLGDGGKFLLICVCLAAVLFLFFFIKWILSLRRVVPTNVVDIVQKRSHTVSYGKDSGNGNSYYKFPAWIPVIGITVITLPTSVFEIDLSNYEAYDQERLPFEVDVKAFYRIADSNIAANRIAAFSDLLVQLTDITRGVVRSLLAKSNLQDIMSERSTYGELFTKEVQEQLKAWGVVPVKNMELMDIRDSRDGKVISDIMNKKKSKIEMESRTEVAENMKKAQEAEIEANKEVALKKEQASQEVGQRKAQVAREVGIADERAKQEVQEQAKVTAERTMAVEKVNQVQLANIKKEANIVKAEEEKQVVIITAQANKESLALNAEGVKRQLELEAEGKLVAKTKESTGIQLEGEARADAEKKMQLASVEAQITLAAKIGENKGYQGYLIEIRAVEAQEKIGVEQAKNLGRADIKVIANAGDVNTGVKSAMDLFSPKGGTAVGGMLEALKNTNAGKSILEKITGKGGETNKGDGR
jgi:flotillin